MTLSVKHLKNLSSSISRYNSHHGVVDIIFRFPGRPIKPLKPLRALQQYGPFSDMWDEIETHFSVDGTYTSL